jgi:hypothetical protein
LFFAHHHHHETFDSLFQFKGILEIENEDDLLGKEEEAVGK